MKIGLEIGEFAWEGGPAQMAQTLVDIARTGDEAGASLIGVGDHLWQGPHAGGPTAPELECFTTLAVVAANTARCLVGPVVAGVHFRAPAVLAKTITTLDVLSGGRAMLGVGVGWYEDEALGMGIDFPSLSDRYAMLEETVQICLGLWEGERGAEQPFRGRFYRLQQLVNVPQNLTRPRPPIMIAGGGEKKTLPLVARYADMCNFYPGPDLPAKLDLLRELCAIEGRAYDAIEKTVIFPFDVSGGPGELTEQLQGLAGQGVDTAIGIISGPQPVKQVEIIGEKVIPDVADA